VAAAASLRVIGMALFYIYVFWNLIRTNPQNRVIQCGSLALIVFFLMIVLMRIPNFPAWYLGPLLFALCILTFIFLIQQGYRAIRDRRKE
jgi:O-antigen/teichoic acid export membrane protein